MGSCKVRPKLSRKNKYYIDKNRRKELEYFCRQYESWKEEYKLIDNVKSPVIMPTYISKNGTSDPTAKLAIRKESLWKKIQLIQDTAKEAEPTISDYLILGVTQDITFPCLSAKLGIPCGKDMYYDRLHKFYWLLDQKRD